MNVSIKCVYDLIIWLMMVRLCYHDEEVSSSISNSSSTAQSRRPRGQQIQPGASILAFSSNQKVTKHSNSPMDSEPINSNPFSLFASTN